MFLVCLKTCKHPVVLMKLDDVEVGCGESGCESCKCGHGTLMLCLVKVSVCASEESLPKEIDDTSVVTVNGKAMVKLAVNKA